MKLYLLGCLLTMTFALSPDCAGSRTAQTKNVSAAPETLPETSSAVDPAPTPTAAAPPKTSAPDLIWQGDSGNFAVEWTKQDIRAVDKASGKTIFSAQKTAARRLKTVYRQNFNKKGAPNFEYFTFGYKIAALVGDFLFLKESTAYSPQTYTTDTFLAIDLKQPAAVVSLNNFYSQNEILQAFLNNSEIKKDLEDNKISLPATLSKFYPLFYTSATDTTEGTERLFDRCWFPKNILEIFTIEQIEADRVEINLGMPCRAGMREDKIYPLKLKFALSEKLKIRMTAADLEQMRINQTQIARQTDETNVGFDAESFKKSK